MSTHSLRVVAFLEHPLFIRAFEELFRARGYHWVTLVCPAWYEDARAYGEVMKVVPGGVDVLFCRRTRSLVDYLSGVDFDILVCFGYPRRIPVEVLERARLGALNGHPSRLPRYRGPNPIGWAFRNGDAELGFTVHRMVHAFDAGAILATSSMPLSLEDDIDSVLGALGGLARETFHSALERLERGEQGEPQSHDAATHAGDFEQGYERIDWSAPARSLHDKVRSLCGSGALAELEGERLCVFKTSLDVRGALPIAPPGTVLGREGDTCIVQCGDGPLRLTAVAPCESGATPRHGGPS